MDLTAIRNCDNQLKAVTRSREGENGCLAVVGLQASCSTNPAAY